MLTTERRYVIEMARHAAAAAVEFSPLNTDRQARITHTERLTWDLMSVIESYLSGHTRTAIVDETAHYRSEG